MKNNTQFPRNVPLFHNAAGGRYWFSSTPILCCSCRRYIGCACTDIYKWRNICCNSQLMYGLPIPKPVAFYRTVSLTMHFYCFYVFLLATVLTEGMKTTQREVERFVCPPFCLFVYIEKIQLREINRRLLVLICSKSPIISPGLIFVQKAFVAGLPYYHLFSRDFNFANLEKEYFAGLKFCDFEESPYLKVIKFRESSNWCSFF